MKKNILIVFGTRPEAIKFAPLINEFRKWPNIFNLKICGDTRGKCNKFDKLSTVQTDVQTILQY